MANIYSYTTGICPTCRELVSARIIENNDEIFLEKMCPAHGNQAHMVSSGKEWFEQSRAYVKPGQQPLRKAVSSFAGCPDSCGLCPEHRQHTCLPVAEITSRCDLNCPICLKDKNSRFSMSVDEYRFALKKLREAEGEILMVNLSGGEPLLHPQFTEFLRVGHEEGVMQTTVSTNGLKLFEDKKLREAFVKYKTIVCLQFDGFEPRTWLRLRGADLAAVKLELIDMLESEGIAYTLTATAAAGVNRHEISAIVDFFFDRKALSLMFQPAAYVGRASVFPADEPRLTIYDVVREIEKSAYVGQGDFNPLPCSHHSCFALAYYIIIDEKNFLSLQDFLGRGKYLDIIANSTLPGLTQESHTILKEHIYECWSAADSGGNNARILERLRAILREISKLDGTAFSPDKAFTLGRANMKGVFVHHFMDTESFDLGRLIKCCNHYLQPDGRLIPICAHNNSFKRSHEQ
ncbi:MAG: radical SAM protein [Desulfarculales bacterium]|jgi:uncharacterized radical SAM superfamily Fe-S cluster-containing enzyme|nr:radical SAM protein [Desulfarculales bacterium]